MNYLEVFGTPITAVRTPVPEDGLDVEMVEYGGGPSHDITFTAPNIEFVCQSRNLGRHDGHCVAWVVNRNDTNLPWGDGWQPEDFPLAALMYQCLIHEYSPNPESSNH